MGPARICVPGVLALLLACGCGRVGFGAAGGVDAGPPGGVDAGGLVATDAGDPGDGGGSGDAAGADAGGPPRETLVFAPPDGVYVSGETITVVVQFDAPVEITGAPYVKLVLDSDVIHVPYAFGSGSTTIHFGWVVEPLFVDANGTTIDSGIRFNDGDAIRGAGGDAVLLAPSFIETPNVIVNASARCPDGYVFVQANPLYGARDFCVQKWEARLDVAGAVVTGPGGMPASVTKDRAHAACAALGADYALMTNDEWQTVARSVEWSAENWSSFSQGAGFLSVGNYSTELGGAFRDDRPCETEGTVAIRFPGCANHASPDFVRNRTHRLSNGQVIWDLAGNVNEWVEGSFVTASRTYACGLVGMEKLMFGPEGDYSAGCPIVEGSSDGRNLGFLEGTAGTNLIRGMQSGAEGTPWEVVIGIFYANANSFWNDGHAGPGFRCAYHPPTTLRAIPVIQPAYAHVATGGRQRFTVRGATPPIVLRTNRSGATFDGTTYVAGPTVDTRDELAVALPGGGSVTAWIDVIAPP